MELNTSVLDVLDGTIPAFDNRRTKYFTERAPSTCAPAAPLWRVALSWSGLACSPYPGLQISRAGEQLGRVPCLGMRLRQSGAPNILLRLRLPVDHAVTSKLMVQDDRYVRTGASFNARAIDLRRGLGR